MLWQIYIVLNVDELYVCRHRLGVIYETNLLSLISLKQTFNLSVGLDQKDYCKFIFFLFLPLRFIWKTSVRGYYGLGS
jgi:hypothetical protein